MRGNGNQINTYAINVADLNCLISVWVMKFSFLGNGGFDRVTIAFCGERCTVGATDTNV